MLNNPYILLVLATLFWGGNFALGKAVSGSIPPMTLSYIRWMEALIFFLPFAWGAINQQKTNALENWPTFVALGVILTNQKGKKELKVQINESVE